MKITQVSPSAKNYSVVSIKRYKSFSTLQAIYKLKVLILKYPDLMMIIIIIIIIIIMMMIMI